MSGICMEESLGAGRFAEGWPFSESCSVLRQVPCTTDPKGLLPQGSARLAMGLPQHRLAGSTGLCYGLAEPCQVQP